MQIIKTGTSLFNVLLILAKHVYKWTCLISLHIDVCARYDITSGNRINHGHAALVPKGEQLVTPSHTRTKYTHAHFY